MLVGFITASTLMASSAMGSVIQQFSRCGTPSPSEEHIAIASDMLEFERSARSTSRYRKTNGTDNAITIPTYFHIVSTAADQDGGLITDEQLMKQLEVMNNDYRPHGFQFELKGTDRTVNSEWALDRNEMAMKQALRIGNYSTLNVYFQTRLRSDALGYCYFPTGAPPGSYNFTRDGCAILWSTVPGGPTENYNLGGTAVHEIGHWMGLFHTFQGGCSAPGDMIDDTPAEASPASGCPTGRDSCTKNYGLDPIHNYMDYTYDACYNEFTPQQGARMSSMWRTFREDK